jgi:hypothetical protein
MRRAYVSVHPNTQLGLHQLFTAARQRSVSASFPYFTKVKSQTTFGRPHFQPPFIASVPCRSDTFLLQFPPCLDKRLSRDTLTSRISALCLCFCFKSWVCLSRGICAQADRGADHAVVVVVRGTNWGKDRQGGANVRSRVWHGDFGDTERTERQCYDGDDDGTARSAASL